MDKDSIDADDIEIIDQSQVNGQSKSLFSGFSNLSIQNSIILETANLKVSPNQKDKDHKQSLKSQKKDRVSLRKERQKNIAQALDTETVEVQDQMQQIQRQEEEKNQIQLGSQQNLSDPKEPTQVQPTPEKDFRKDLLAKNVDACIRELIKVEQLNGSNYSELELSTRQLAKKFLKIYEGSPQNYKQFIPVEQITHQFKKLLKTCEDKHNLHEIIQKQIQIKTYELQNSNPQIKPQIQFEQAKYLAEQGQCLLDIGNYFEAIKVVQKSTPALQKKFLLDIQNVQRPHESYFSKLKNLFSISRNQDSPEQKNRKTQESQQNIQASFSLLVDSLHSLAKCYENTVKPQKKLNSLIKSQQHINQYQKLIKSKYISPESEKRSQLLNKKITLLSLVDKNSAQMFKLKEKHSQLVQTLQTIISTQTQPAKLIQSHCQLIEIRQVQLKNGLKDPNGQFDISYAKGQQLQISQILFKEGRCFDQQKYNSIVQKCKQNYKKSIELMKQSGKNDIKLLQVRNNFAEFLFKANYFSQSIDQSAEVLSNPITLKHTSGSIASLNIGKACLARGNCKNAFQNINKSYKILKDALLKDTNSDKYRQILLRSENYRNIQLTRVKIYNSQMRHDLVVKTLQFLTPKNFPKEINYLYMANIHEEMGNSLALEESNEPQKFIQEFRKSIQIHSKLDKNCLENGILACNIVKYLISKSDQQNQLSIQNKLISEWLAKARQIFKQYSSEHPSTWPLLFIESKLAKNDIKNSEELMRKAVKLVSMRHGKDHIITFRIRLHECLVSSQEQKLQKLESLQTDLAQCITKEGEKLNELQKKLNENRDERNLLIDDEKSLLNDEIKNMIDIQQIEKRRSEKMEDSKYPFNVSSQHMLGRSQNSISEEEQYVQKVIKVRIRQESDELEEIGGQKEGEKEQKMDKILPFEGSLSEVSEY